MFKAKVLDIKQGDLFKCHQFSIVQKRPQEILASLGLWSHPHKPSTISLCALIPESCPCEPEGKAFLTGF